MSKPGGDPSSGISLGDVLRLPERHPAYRRREAQLGSCTERENLIGDAKGKGASGSNREAESTDAPGRGGLLRSVRWASHEGCRLPLSLRAPPSTASWPKLNDDDLPPSLHEHYTRFNATTRQSAPLRRIGTFGLAVGAACTFSLTIAGQVLTFHPGA